MTTLPHRPNTTLLVLDMQVGVLEGAHERDSVVGNIGSLVERARRTGIPVIWFQYSDEQVVSGSDGWQIVPELTPTAAEPVLQKHYSDPFEETSLEPTLADLAVGRLFVVGAQTDECIRATLHGAFVRGYDAILVSDAHTTQDLTEWGRRHPKQSSPSLICTGATTGRRVGQPER